MLKRHEVEILLKAGHRKTEVAWLAGVSLCSVKRIAQEGPVVHVESWPHHQASPFPQSDFNARIAGRARPRPRYVHFQELRWRVFLQPLLPHEKVRPAQTVLTTKRFHTLSATCLLGNQPSPLHPGLL
jgi:hypothetical protein